MKIKEIVKALDEFAPLSLQESYDNAGLIVGAYDDDVSKALISFDVTEEVVDEALREGAGMIISHHPVIFGGLKKLNGSNYVERVVIKAIKNNIALYAAHTNLDNLPKGTNRPLALKLGLKNLKVLEPQGKSLLKLVVFVPESHADKVRTAIFDAGAGVIGNYDRCSFNAHGQGSFRAGENTNPFVGEQGSQHFEDEVRIETILPAYLKGKVISAMLAAHPYEEVAYDIYMLENKTYISGAGLIGSLEKETEALDFLRKLKEITGGCIRYTPLVKNKVKKIALCGGSGAFLIKKAKAAGADVYITGDVKYHEFFDAEDKMIIADIGHYESEQFTKDILYEFIKEKFPTFAVQKSGIVTNPVNYL